MIRQIWAKIGRRKGAGAANSDEMNPEQSVVPLRGRKSRESGEPESLIVTKKDHIERFTETVHQVVEKLEGIGTHLGRQAEQTNELLEKMGQLPEMLKAMPEAAGRQEEAVRSLLALLEEKSRRDEAMMETLSSLPEQADRQSRALEEIGRHAGQSAEAGNHLNEKMGQACEALDKLDQATAGQTEWLEHMSRTFVVTDRYLKLTLAKQHRRFLWMLAICMGICLLSVVGLVVGILLMRQGM